MISPSEKFGELGGRVTSELLTHFAGLHRNSDSYGSYIGVFVTAAGEIANLPQDQWHPYQLFHTHMLDKGRPTKLADPPRDTHYFETLVQEQICFEQANLELTDRLLQDFELAQTSAAAMNRNLIERLTQASGYKPD